MSSGYPSWAGATGNARQARMRAPAQRTAGRPAPVERRESDIRGRQLAQMRKAAGVTQADLAKELGVSQARVSRIEHGDISGIDVIRAYVNALGGTIELIARLGDRSWNVA